MSARAPGGLLLATLLLASAAVSAQVFECTDARGAREYSNVCPPGTVRQRALTRTDDVPPPPVEAKSTAQEDAEFRKRQQERQDAEAKANEDRIKAEEAERNCTIARTQLRGLLEGQRMQRIDPDTGERINLGDEDRAVEAERQQQLVAQWCK
jgi:Domain of unknown function (DUF4124)